MNEFSAFRVSNEPQFSAEVKTIDENQLPTGDVLVKVAYSDINYKDALAATEKGGVIRNYPMTPGIDLSGEIVESNDRHHPIGQEILVTGYGLGVTAPGGFSEYQRVPSEWLVKLPTGLTKKDAMIYGTAGFTAALCVEALEKNVAKDQPVIVTGASGGVGSVAIALLKKIGYQEIIAVSRKANATDWLRNLGATQIVTPAEITPEKARPLDKQNFGGLIDTVGGELLAALLPQLHYGGTAAICGNAGGIKLQTTVLPFILRGIQMIGIDSVNVPMAHRTQIWQKLATDWHVVNELNHREISLEEVPETVASLLAGTHQGRTIIKL